MNSVDPAANVTQCDQANKLLGHNDCCSASMPNGCVQPGWPEFAKYGFKADLRFSPLTWAEVKVEIGCHKRPFGFAWGYPGGSGHMMVAVGYTSEKEVIYNDPSPPNEGVDHVAITYEYFVGGIDHIHWRDYYNVRRK